MSPALRSLEKGKRIGLQRVLPKERMTISPSPRYEQGLEARFNYGIGSPPGERGNIGQLLIVDHLPQFFTSFEEGHSFGRNMNTLPCLGVSTIP